MREYVGRTIRELIEDNPVQMSYARIKEGWRDYVELSSIPLDSDILDRPIEKIDIYDGGYTISITVDFKEGSKWHI